MRLRIYSMRWWLALAFAAVAAVTALSVAEVFTSRSEERIRERGRELAAGEAVTAAVELASIERERIPSVARALGESRGLALFVLDERGAPITRSRVGDIRLEELSNYEELRDTALAGRRLVDAIDDGRLVTVALPLRGEDRAGLIAVAPRSDLEDALGIVRSEIVRSALLAVGIGASVGLLVALLITRRLRRIADAAREIEQGNFDRELSPRFRDELGELAKTIDDMRDRLRGSFASLEGEKDRLGRLLEQLQEGVVAVDENLRIEFANTRAHAIVGGAVEPGAPLPDPWPSFSLPTEAARLFDHDASPRTIRVQLTSDASYVVTLLPPSSVSRTGVVVLTDVTEQERRERAEREFVMNAAHELRTPLAAIAGAVEALQTGAMEQCEDRDRFLEIVDRQTRRLTRLTHALLTLARAQTRSEPVRLEAVRVASVLQDVAEEISVPPDVRVCCRDLAARAHPDLLRQALENLVTNAIKHADGRGLALHAAHTDDGRVRIDVVDDGPGMDRRVAARAGDRFYRGRGPDSQGFGLGLAIVRAAVEAMNGTFSIETAPGSGTTVSVVLEAIESERVHA